MTLALMQPYFFPYIGYFNLVAATDHFYFFDTVQLSPKSWMTRNRLLTPHRTDAQYFRPETEKVSSTAPLLDCKLRDSDEWQPRIISQLKPYKRFAPYYSETLDFVQEVFEKERNTTSLAELNMNTTVATARYLGLPAQFHRLSQATLSYQVPAQPQYWGMEVCMAVGASAYVNAPGGEGWIAPEPFVANNLRLGFVKPALKPYVQKNGGTFIASLSVLDVLMWNGRYSTEEMAKNAYSIDWKC
jgi:hypothetical protein